MGFWGDKMKTLNEIQSLLSKHKQELAEKYKVKDIGVFGSFVHNRQKMGSDIDLLVDFKETLDFFEFLELEEYLSELLEIKVDLVMKSTLKPKIGERILSEVIYV